MPPTGFTAIWEFHVNEELRPAFEKAYGRAGAWTQLFRLSPDYLGTDLLHDLGHPGRYLTLDHWNSREAFQQFKQEHHAGYAALDQQCEELTEREVFVGDFNMVEESNS